MSFVRFTAIAALTGAASILAVSVANSQTATNAAADAAYGFAAELLPPEAKPGECYARVFIPGTEKRIENKVLIKEATEQLQVIPAVYSDVEETVVVETASEKLEIIPAVYKTEEKVVIIEPEREVQTVVPAVYEEAEEKVKVREAYSTWKKGEGPIQRYDTATGEIMCLVTIPAEYKTVKKRVVKIPPRTTTKVIPAVTKTVSVRVMVEAPKTRTVKIPAKTEKVKVRKLMTPASVKTIDIPAQYETVYETQKDSDGGVQWRPILCNTNATPELITRLQTVLEEKGYNPGSIDGVLGGGTMEAVRRYQRAQGIAQGELTMETLKELDVM